MKAGPRSDARPRLSCSNFGRSRAGRRAAGRVCVLLACLNPRTNPCVGAWGARGGRGHSARAPVALCAHACMQHASRRDSRARAHARTLSARVTDAVQGLWFRVKFRLQGLEFCLGFRVYGHATRRHIQQRAGPA